MRNFLFAALAGSVFLCACTKNPAPLSPLGPVSATGTLIRAEASLLRRGSHILIQEGEQTYYVESKTLSLTPFEGQTIHVVGKAEMNTEKDTLPVLVVSTLEATRTSGKDRAWEIPALDLKLSAPEDWKGSLQKNVASFMLPGESIALVVIRPASGAVLPAGTPFFVANHRAVRKSQGQGSAAQDIFIQNKSVILHFHFDAATQASVTRIEDAKVLEALFERMVTTIAFLSDASASPSKTGTGSSVACGGPAGVLCPAGYFCDVYDIATRIGSCRKIGGP